MTTDPEMERLEANLRDAIKPFLRKMPDVQLWKAFRQAKIEAGFCGFGGCSRHHTGKGYCLRHVEPA